MEGGGDMMLVCKLFGVEMDLLGVKRRELVGGPPGLSLVERFKDVFSLSNCGPLREWPGRGVWGAEGGF